MNDLWNAKRKSRESAMQEAAQSLFEHMGTAAAFKIPLFRNQNDLFIIAGEKGSIKDLLGSDSHEVRRGEKS